MLDEKHMEAIRLLSPKTMSKSKIAERVGISTRTLNRWENDEEFKAELDQRREQLKKTDNRVRFQANKYLIDQCLGSPSAAKEEVKATTGEGNTDTNTLKAELEGIKNLTVVK